MFYLLVLGLCTYKTYFFYILSDESCVWSFHESNLLTVVSLLLAYALFSLLFFGFLNMSSYILAFHLGNFLSPGVRQFPTKDWFFFSATSLSEFCIKSYHKLKHYWNLGHVRDGSWLLLIISNKIGISNSSLYSGSFKWISSFKYSTWER